MNLSGVILGPVVSEKAMALAEHNQHTLLVDQKATKAEIKSAVKKFFGVDPVSVAIIKIPQKIRVRSQRGPQPKRKPRTKAIITLRAGEVFDPLKPKGVPEPKKSAKKSSSDTK